MYRIVTPLDLFGQTSIHDCFDIIRIADLVFGEHCLLTILAEAMDRKGVCMFSTAARDSGTWIANVTPGRMIHKKHLQEGIYDD